MSGDMWVVDHDEGWARAFQEIRARLWPAVAAVAVGIEHVGSTAVPGMAAKPIIDVDVVVADAGQVASAVAALESLGHRHRGDLGIPGREAFSMLPDLPAHHLYVVVQGSGPHCDHVDLRDHLRLHPEAARRYAAEKRRLAPLLATNREAYVRGKAGMIQALLRAARGC